MLDRALRALALTALGALPACAADHLGSHAWRPGWEGAGGYSALWLDGAGRRFVALSDRGGWVEGVLERDEAGVVAEVVVGRRGPLLRSTGEPLRPRETDAEAIARAGGTFYVAYEGTHRVMRHAALGDAPERMPQHPDFEAFQSNSGLEALAADAEGRLYAIPERSRGRGYVPLPLGRAVPADPRGDDHPHPVYRYEDGAWAYAFSLPRDRAWLVAGADVGPDGRLYVLERAFVTIGFRSRLRSYGPDGSDMREELVTPLRAHDNLEALSVWRDAQGRMRATMLSDDNLRFLQTTEFVDYVLSGAALPEG